MQIKNRIKELHTVRAADLIPNPKNWREHPIKQRDALKGILAEVGYADSLLARETPKGRMLIEVVSDDLETLPPGRKNERRYF